MTVKKTQIKNFQLSFEGLRKWSALEILRNYYQLGRFQPKTIAENVHQTAEMCEL